MWNSAASSDATNSATGYHHQGVRSRSRYCTEVSLRALMASRVASRPVTDARTDLGSEADPGVSVLVQRLDPDLPLPLYALPGDAGADIVTAQDVTLAPG